MFRGKPRTVGELYENIMKKGTRKLETGRNTYRFYITPSDDRIGSWTSWINVNDNNIKQYEKIVVTGKIHDDWDEYVCFQIDDTKENKNVQKNSNKRQ